jgi:hypothetical protein
VLISHLWETSWRAKSYHLLIQTNSTNKREFGKAALLEGRPSTSWKSNKTAKMNHLPHYPERLKEDQ